MAADHYLSEESRTKGIPALRLYTWEVPTLSLGFHQRFSDDVALRCEDQSVPIVRRPTGGRAVLHDRELTYCLTIPNDHQIFKGDRSEMLKSIGAVFVTAAREAGLNAQLVRAGGHGDSNSDVLRKGSPLCFDALSRWEVQLDGRKWIGSAQRFLPGVLLQHGSIILGKSSVNIARLFNLPDGSEEVVEISDDQAIKLLDVIPSAFAEAWNIDWQLMPFISNEVINITKAAVKYSYTECLNSSAK